MIVYLRTIKYYFYFRQGIKVIATIGTRKFQLEIMDSQ